MAWSWIAPPKSYNLRTQNGAFRNYADVHSSPDSSNSYDFYADTPAYVDIPSLSKLNLLTECLFASYFKNSHEVIKICSDNHTITLKRDGKDTLNIYMDEELVISGIKFRPGEKFRFYFTMQSGENGKIEFWINSGKQGEYKGSVLNSEPIKTFYICDSYAPGYDSYYFLVASEEPIPQSATVKVVTPEVETDWEQGEKGVYQTSEVGKTMKLKTPENAATAGKVVVCSAPFLHDAVAGGNVNGIIAHSSYYDEDMPILNTNRSIGFRSGDDTVFTTRG